LYLQYIPLMIFLLVLGWKSYSLYKIKKEHVHLKDIDLQITEYFNANERSYDVNDESTSQA
jgi:hypothetical protein